MFLAALVRVPVVVPVVVPVLVFVPVRGSAGFNAEAATALGSTVLRLIERAESSAGGSARAAGRAFAGAGAGGERSHEAAIDTRNAA